MFNGYRVSILQDERSSLDAAMAAHRESYGSTQRRRWHPTPVLLPGKSHGQRSLVGCGPGVAKSDFTFHFHALGKEMQPTPVFLPGESQGRGSLVGCRLWGRTESDMTEAT